MKMLVIGAKKDPAPLHGPAQAVTRTLMRSNTPRTKETATNSASTPSPLEAPWSLRAISVLFVCCVSVHEVVTASLLEKIGTGCSVPILTHSPALSLALALVDSSE